jgi:RHS repeat-associated protein
MNNLRSLLRRPTLLGRGLLALLLCLIAAQAAAVQTTTVTYYHTDLIGSVVATSDEAGIVSWRSAYLPYGEQWMVPPNPDDRQGFAGKPLGAGAVIDFGARAYDPGIGRFQGLDPQPAEAGDPHGFNRYAYANNNPYRYTDPDGEFPIVAVAMLAIDLALNYQATGSVKGALIETGKGLINPLKKIKLAGKVGAAVKKVLGRSSVTKRGLGGNPFQEKTPQQIDKIFRDKGFDVKGTDPIAGKGSYINPKTGRKFYIDKGGKYKKGTELPHVDVHRPPSSSLPKKKLPLGNRLIE